MRRLGPKGLVAPFALLMLAFPAVAGPVGLPNGQEVKQVDFERHVQALLGRQGCNAGACHGSFQGKGGMVLSLFGYSAEKDYLAFTREAQGRRLSPANPDHSLMLLKASGQVPHGGDMRFGKDSWQYRLIREWIARGADWQPGSGDVKRLEVVPAEQVLGKPGDGKKLQVLVEFADGSREDVTWFSDFKVSDDYVAEVSRAGEVRGLRPGDTAIVVSYRGQVRTARVLIPAPVGADFVFPKIAEVNYIDREVFGKLRKLNIVPSDLSSDTEFLRRAYIDTIGSLPSPEDIRAFVTSKDPAKRDKKIDELLKHPMHAALWATKFSDITGNNVDAMDFTAGPRPKVAKMWHDWFRKRLAENMPYDQIVKGVLCATSQDGKTPEEWMKQATAIQQQAARGFDTDYPQRDSLDLFWRKNNFPVEQMAEHTAAAFLGIRLECAQCHKHPFDRWTQEDYRSYAKVFTHVRLGPPPNVAAGGINANAARQKLLADALAKVDQENRERRLAAEKKIDQENAQLRQAAEKALDQDKADAERKREVLSALDRENEARKRATLVKIDRENQVRRFQVQQQFAAIRPPQQMRAVYVSDIAPPAPRLPNAPPKFDYSLIPAKALGGPGVEMKGDPRVALFEWLRRPDNPYFARSFVNRVWAHYFGQGLVEPVDNFSVANPPSNDKLLDALAKDFTAHNYDIRHLERNILLSRAYQLSAVPNASNKHDRKNYSRAALRPMMAEVVVDVLNSALGVGENFGPEVPPGARAIEVAPNRLLQNPTLAQLFQIFGRPPRTSTCDCERATDPALPRTLFLMTDPNVLNKITNPDGRLMKLLADKKSDKEVAQELFLATLSRFPTDKETRSCLDHVEKRGRQAGFVDLVWALINTREFILNH